MKIKKIMLNLLNMIIKGNIQIKKNILTNSNMNMEITMEINIIQN